MKYPNALFIITILGALKVCNTYRILAIYGLPVRSHFIMYNEILNGLAAKGHQVDVVSVLSLKDTKSNYSQIIKLPEHTGLLQKGFSYYDAHNFTKKLIKIGLLGCEVCEYLANPELLSLARNPPKDPPYDLVITQMLHYQCFTVFGHLWNIPVALISTTAFYPWMHDVIGNPESLAFASNYLENVEPGLSRFFDRLRNVYYFYLHKLSYLYYSQAQDKMLKKYFGEDLPSLRELERNVSLVLVNTHYTVNGVRPMTSGIVEVGGLHVKDSGPELTDDLKKWLDESKDGVIYFSFGSIIRIDTTPKEVLEIIFKTLERAAPVRVLMRIVDPKRLPIKVPKNFYILPWIPQVKVLQHPNVKVFVTHGGALGTQEAIHFGVPMICIPFFADQFTNTNNYVERKIAVKVDIRSITQEKFDEVVSEILNNPIYRENVKILSRLFKDRPEHPLDKAIYWIEYVIRNGKNSLRSPAMDFTWWQLALLDIILFVVGIIIVALLIAVFIIKKLFNLVCPAERKVSYKDKKI